MKLAIALLCLVVGSARADAPALVSYTGNGVTVLVPARWVVTVDVNQGSLVAKADPERKDAAVLMLGVRQGAGQTSEDALVGQIAAASAKDVRIAWRGVPPGGHGHALIADGSMDGISGRLAAIAVIANGTAVFGIVAAKRPEFDALGGLGTLETVMGSLHGAAEGRPAPAGGAIARTDLERTWGPGGNTITFRADGTYKLLYSFVVKSGTCTTTSTSAETGTYESDGRTLLLEPKDASARTLACMHKASDQKLAAKGPRSYAISLTSDGSLVMVGPGCSSLDEIGCADRGRRELKPGK